MLQRRRAAAARPLPVAEPLVYETLSTLCSSLRTVLRRVLFLPPRALRLGRHGTAPRGEGSRKDRGSATEKGLTRRERHVQEGGDFVSRLNSKTLVQFACVGVPALDWLFTWTVPGTHAGIGAIMKVAFEAWALYLGMEVVSRISPAEALAMGYFYGFVEPVVERLKAGCQIRKGGTVKRYGANCGHLEIRLPGTLGLDPDEQAGLPQSLKDKEASGTKAEIVMSGKIKDFAVHVADHSASRVTIVDVPNALSTLRLLVLEGPIRDDDRERLALKMLNEFRSALQTRIHKRGYSSAEVQM
jgi:hypothetical protein